MAKKFFSLLVLILFWPGPSETADSAVPFGRWADEPTGEPVFIYTMDEFQDPRAFSPTSLGPSNDHWHLVGNGRMVALAYNHGEVEIYSGERGAAWINERAPPRRRFAGGYGFLLDGNTLLSLRYPDRPKGCEAERRFGIGYFQKTLICPDLRVTQTTYAPAGEDTFLISEVQIENLSPAPRRLTWYEYWDVNPHYFGMMPEAAAEEGESTGEGKGLGELTPLVTKSLRYIPGRYALSRLVVRALHAWRGSATADFLLSTCKEADALAAVLRSPRPPVRREDRSEVDHYPPVFFLAPLFQTDQNTDRFETRRAVAFDRRGNFTGELENGFLPETSRKRAAACLILARRLKSSPVPGAPPIILRFAAGYAPPHLLNETVQRAKKAAAVPDSSVPLSFKSEHLAAWKTALPAVRTGLDWLDREMVWHAYYLRAMATYDEYFQNRIISQGCAYQYVMGMNIAARDPLQHMLPLIYLEPALAREVLRFTLRMMNEKGFIPYGIKGVGVWTGGGNPFPSDTNLYLLLAAAEYVTATRDFAFLQEDLPYYPREAGRRGTVLEHLKRAYAHQLKGVGIGAHGLIKLRNSDWNDAFLAEEKVRDPKLDLAEVEQEAESVLNTAMAAYILPRFAGVARLAGEEVWAEEMEAQAVSFRQAAAAQWNCRWYNRALLPNGRVVGEDRLYLEPQPWAVLAGVPELAVENALLETIHAELSSRSPIGAVLSWPPPPPEASFAEKPGMGTNGGVWYSLRLPLVTAYARLRPEYAWEEFLKMTLHTHAAAYPQTWIGLWSGPDAYNAPYSARPGEAGDLFPFSGGMSDFPVMNAHAHAVPWFALIKLFGINPEPQGFTIDPTIPGQNFSLATELLSLRREEKSCSGALRPLNNSTVVFRVRVPRRPEKIMVQEKPGAVQMDGDFAVFTVAAESGKTAGWSLQWP